MSIHAGHASLPTFKCFQYAALYTKSTTCPIAVIAKFFAHVAREILSAASCLVDQLHLLSFFVDYMADTRGWLSCQNLLYAYILVYSLSCCSFSYGLVILLIRQMLAMIHKYILLTRMADSLANIWATAK